MKMGSTKGEVYMSTEQAQLQDYMRLPAEILYREELEALIKADTG
jgi:hypothetical protein